MIKNKTMLLGCVALFLGLNNQSFAQDMSSDPRIELLIQQNEVLVARLNTLETELKQLKNSASNPGANSVHQIPAVVARGSADKLKLTLSGQVNRTGAYYDSGARSELKHLDNNSNSTRLNVTAERKIQNTQLGAVIEGEISGNNTRNSDIGQNNTTTSLTERKLETYIKVQKYGELWVGKGDSAAHRASDCDLSGKAAVLDGADFAIAAGGVRFVNRNAPEATFAESGPGNRDRSIVDVYTEIFGSNRINRIKYVTPAVKGFTLAVVHAMRDYFDTALRFSGTINKVEVLAAIAYANTPFSRYLTGSSLATRRFGYKDWGGSASVLFPTGISLGGHYATRRFGDAYRQRGYSWSTTLGYQKNFFALGKTAVAAAYGQGRRLFGNFDGVMSSTPATWAQDNSEKINIAGLYLVQNIDSLSTEAYIAYQWHRLTRDNINTTTGAFGPIPFNFGAIQAVLFGARVKF